MHPIPMFPIISGSTTGFRTLSTTIIACCRRGRRSISNRCCPEKLRALPLAQTIWYIPSGLDIWNQKILKAPGHYATRGFKMPDTTPPAPVVYWPDQEPLAAAGPLNERLNHWLTLVERGQVIDAYRIFLGLMEETEHRREVLAQLVFAGLIDVQDRMLYNRSYTTGHKAYRARSVVEIGNAIGWDNAHDTIYAGALDIAVGPRWHSVYEMACNVVTIFIEGAEVHAVPQSGTSERERALLVNTGGLSEPDAAALVDALIREHEPAYIEKISSLLLAGTAPRRIVDAIQLAAAQVILETEGPNNFSMPQHTYEYCNTLGWFYDNFAHPQRLKLLYVAGSMVNQAAWNQALMGWSKRAPIAAPGNAARLDGAAIIGRLEAALAALDAPQSVAWTKAYLDSGADRARAGAASGADGLALRQRPAQPGNPAMPAAGLLGQSMRRPRPAAARLRPYLRRAPKIRRHLRGRPPLRRGDGPRRIELSAGACRQKPVIPGNTLIIRRQGYTHPRFRV